MRNSLQFKLLIAFMLIISLTLGSVIFGISLFIKDQVVADKQNDLLQKGTELAQSIQFLQNFPKNTDRLNDFLSHADQYLGARIWILDKSRQVIAISGGRMGMGNMQNMHMGNMGLGMGNMRPLIGQLDPVYNGQILTKIMEQPYYGEKMVVVAVPIKQADGTVIGSVLLNAPVTGINDFMQRIYYYIGAGGLIALFFAFLIANRLTQTIVKPLKEMETATETLAKGDYNIRINPHSSDEVGRLGSAINSLAQELSDYMGELEKAEQLRREFVANVSHELRTPLTILRSYTEALLDGIITEPNQVKNHLHDMQEEIVRLEHLVKDLLDLSRLQNETAAWHTEPIPLPDIADGALHMFQQKVIQKGITLHLEAENSVPLILGNGERLTQLLFIFLDNAVQHTPSGGSITVSIKQTTSAIELAVADTGTGIAQEDLPHIWERFYKADKSHQRTDTGAGLGLAIAKQIIERHKANVTVSSRLGEGTKFTVEFPLPNNA